MNTLTTTFVTMSILFIAHSSFAMKQSENFVLPVTYFLSQCDVSNMKESVDTLITTNENIMLLKSKQKMSLRNYAVSLVKRMSKGTPDENVAEQDIVFTEFYQFPNDYPSAINKMDSISHSFRVTFSSPSGVEYFFHVVTPTYKLVNLKLPPANPDELEIAGTNGSYIDTGITSLESLSAADLCLPIKIDSSGEGRFGK